MEDLSGRKFDNRKFDYELLTDSFPGGIDGRIEAVEVDFICERSKAW
jgi:hypothetical protein